MTASRAAVQRHATPPRSPRPAPAPLAASPRIGRLEEEVRRGVPGAVESFWGQVAEEGAPLVEAVPGGDANGGTARADEVIATFVHRGGPALAMVNKLHDRADPAASRMRNVTGTDVWWLAYRLPADWRGSYHLVPGDGPGDLAAAVPDPHGPRRLAQPGGADKSVAAMPQAPADDHLDPPPGTPAGAVAVHALPSTVLGNSRRVWVHVPHGRSGAGVPVDGYPVLVLLDGATWFETAPIAPALDHLYARGELPPMVTVAVDTLGPSVRGEELTCHVPFVRFLTDELLPWAERRWRIARAPERTIIAGQSLGGLAAAFAAGSAPERIGCVLAQSPSLWWRGRGPGGEAVPDGREWLTDWYARRARLPVRFHLEVGRDEWVNLLPARRFRDVLERKGYPVVYREFGGGHDLACWRVGIAGGLASLTRGW
ncbi:alpha/beta hydrolase-fold protein [Tomitella gaofuii]|uniref:alpha/beta hydrolase-fold protein n=1 Tax=Tomitella gaofuii TaxID=2760083 RepID=UPI0015FC3E51|nr:alpha/beta hydrolase-fold protein [Tomitella gaofuii]